MNALERLIYEWGRLATTFYPAGRWRWEKEWERRADDDKYSKPTESAGSATSANGRTV